LAQKKLGAQKKLATPAAHSRLPILLGSSPHRIFDLVHSTHAEQSRVRRARRTRARRRRAIFGVGLVPKGCIWSNFWRNEATQKWRHRVFFIAVQRICAFAGMPGHGGTMKA
jgi:hypothetical protein